MQLVRDALAPEYPDLIITQDDMAKGEVLRQHCARVDEGRPSVLFGVASLNRPPPASPSVSLIRTIFIVPFRSLHNKYWSLKLKN